MRARIAELLLRCLFEGPEACERIDDSDSLLQVGNGWQERAGLALFCCGSSAGQRCCLCRGQPTMIWRLSAPSELE